MSYHGHCEVLVRPSKCKDLTQENHQVVERKKTKPKMKPESKGRKVEPLPRAERKRRKDSTRGVNFIIKQTENKKQ